MSLKEILTICLVAVSWGLFQSSCDRKSSGLSGGIGASDSDSDSDSDVDSGSDTESSETHLLVLQNGLNGYDGCFDTAVVVPPVSGWNEITPFDEQMTIFHDIWTGS